MSSRIELDLAHDDFKRGDVAPRTQALGMREGYTEVGETEAALAMLGFWR